MENLKDFKRYKEHANHRLLVILTKSQKDRIRMLAEASGYKTISNFVRISLLNPSVEMKLNEILKTVKEIQEKIPPCKCKKQIDEPECKK